MNDFLAFKCARCGSTDRLALLYNRPHREWLCRSCMLVETHRDRTTEYWAEEYDEPIGQARDPVYYMPVSTRAFRGRRVA